MSSIDQQFIEYVVKALVSNPDAVIVERRIDEKGVLLELTVDPEDLGRVIGKRGATAQSLRTLLRALGTKNDARYNLKIVDNGTGAEGESDNNGERPLRDDNRSKADEGTAAAVGAAATATYTSDDDQTALSTADSSTDPDEYPVRPQDDSQSQQTTGRQDDDDSRVSKTRRELQELDDLDV